MFVGNVQYFCNFAFHNKGRKYYQNHQLYEETFCIEYVSRNDYYDEQLRTGENDKEVP